MIILLRHMFKVYPLEGTHPTNQLNLVNPSPLQAEAETAI